MLRPGSLVRLIDVSTGAQFGQVGVVIGFVKNSWNNKIWLFVKVLWQDSTESLYSPEGLSEIDVYKKEKNED
jgi:hypothetical protein